MPVKMRLIDLDSNRELTTWIQGGSRAVAEDGLLVEADQVIVDGVHIFTDAMKEGRGLELEWDLPADGGHLEAQGRVLWFRLAPQGSPHPFLAAVRITQMGGDGWGRWDDFIKGLPG